MVFLLERLAISMMAGKSNDQGCIGFKERTLADSQSANWPEQSVGEGIFYPEE